MTNNFTPLNREVLERIYVERKHLNGSRISLVLLLLATLTLLALAAVLYFLIQKKMEFVPISLHYLQAGLCT